MIDWFGKKDIDLVRLDDRGWRLNKHCSDFKIWTNDYGDILSLNFFNVVPDIPVSLSETTELRNFYRKMVSDVGGGIIKVETIELKTLPVIECIFKIAMDTNGILYLGSLTIPFSDKSYVIKLECPELGITGLRDSIIFSRHIDFDKADDDNFDPLKGWNKDPYDEDLSQGVLMNLSENELYDAQFPNHPLSRIRKYLSHIKKTIRLDKKLFNWDSFS